jgi:alkylation response protein AidB-like acyl-CoA dehydrogenase
MTEWNSEERLMLAQTVELLVVRQYSPDNRRNMSLEPTGYNRAAWTQMAELGLLGLGVPTALGGSGGSVVELGIVMAAIGRHLMTEPFFGTAVVCAPLLASLDPDGKLFDLRSVLTGEQIVAFAHFEPQLGYARSPLSTRYNSTDHTGVTVSGCKNFVLDAPNAQTLLITAEDEDGELGVFVASAHSKGIRMRSFLTVDRRWAADLELTNVPAVRLGEGDVSKTVERMIDQASIALGFEAVGSMGKLVEDTCNHVKSRRAFKGALSQFQVLRHRLVDMFIAWQETDAFVEAVAFTYCDPSSWSSGLAAAAKFQSSRAAQFVADNAVQLHGGLGVSDEMPVSHHFKRLMVNEALYGNADHQLDRFIEVPTISRKLDAMRQSSCNNQGESTCPTNV